jgi:hypothetical protein
MDSLFNVPTAHHESELTDGFGDHIETTVCNGNNERDTQCLNLWTAIIQWKSTVYLMNQSSGFSQLTNVPICLRK